MIDPAHAGATAWSERHMLAIPAWHPAEWLSVLHCTQAQNHSAADEREPLDLRSNSAAVRQRKPSLGDAARLYLDAKSTQIRPQSQSSTPRSLFASIRVLDQLDVRPIAGTEGGLNPFFFARWPISRFFHLSGAQTRSDGRWSSYDDLRDCCLLQRRELGRERHDRVHAIIARVAAGSCVGRQARYHRAAGPVKVFGRRLRIRLKRSTLTDAVAFRPHPTSMS